MQTLFLKARMGVQAAPQTRIRTLFFKANKAPADGSPIPKIGVLYNNNHQAARCTPK